MSFDVVNVDVVDVGVVGVGVEEELESVASSSSIMRSRSDPTKDVLKPSVRETEDDDKGVVVVDVKAAEGAADAASPSVVVVVVEATGATPALVSFVSPLFC